MINIIICYFRLIEVFLVNHLSFLLNIRFPLIFITIPTPASNRVLDYLGCPWMSVEPLCNYLFVQALACSRPALIIFFYALDLRVFRETDLFE